MLAATYPPCFDSVANSLIDTTVAYLQDYIRLLYETYIMFLLLQIMSRF
jgi:hypothetical protein